MASRITALADSGAAPAAPPSPGHEQNLAEQRRRLLVAMVDAIADGGYRATRVADVIARAGTSRKTFYRHFANKQECFLAAYDLISEQMLRRMEHAFEAAEGWPGRAEAAIGALFETAGENPGALRLATVEICALEATGIERRERSISAYQRFIAEAVELAPGEGAIPQASARAIVGGLTRILQRRVSADERAGQLGLVPDLVRWATSYYPAPEAVAAGAGDRRAGARRTRFDGGRAPGTLAPRPTLASRRGLARGNHNVSRSFVIHSQRERVLDAVANLTAAHGYAAVGIDDIASEAAISLQAFYEHFADKEDALLVAYELGHAKGLTIFERAYAVQEQWPQAVRAGIAALFDFLASEPAFAHLALVEVMTATPRTAARSYMGVNAFAQMLLPGLEQCPDREPLPAVAIEAIVGGLFELCLQYAQQGRIERLPELTVGASYVALAPFLGGDEAARVASG